MTTEMVQASKFTNKQYGVADKSLKNKTWTVATIDNLQKIDSKIYFAFKFNMD